MRYKYQKTLYHTVCNFVAQIINGSAVHSIILDGCTVSLNAFEVTVKDNVWLMIGESR